MTWAALAGSVFDADGCEDGHTYDDNCSWRSPIEREGHLAAAAALRLGRPDMGTEEAEEMVSDVIDALYANGLAVHRG